jgi:hypothetical protein
MTGMDTCINKVISEIKRRTGWSGRDGDPRRGLRGRDDWDGHLH